MVTPHSVYCIGNVTSHPVNTTLVGVLAIVRFTVGTCTCMYSCRDSSLRGWAVSRKETTRLQDVIVLLSPRCLVYVYVSFLCLTHHSHKGCCHKQINTDIIDRSTSLG